MTRNEQVKRNREQILRLAKRYGVTDIRVFGSTAREDDTYVSDIDFLVELEPDRSLFDVGGLLMELETLLGCKVDVLTEKSLHWYIRERVLSEARAICIEKMFGVKRSKGKFTDRGRRLSFGCLG
jgi:predicted nucleotidyltransferase